MAGILTLNLVLQKSKVDDISRVTKLNVCSAQLQDIGVLRQGSNLEVLSLSLNDISELGAISGCRRLRELYLRRNQIRDINQVLHLTRLQFLEVLNLSDNPISRDPNYRRFIVAAIPSLERLDDLDISDNERDAAVRVFPELIYFAPPASRYADAPEEGYAPPPQAQAQSPPLVKQQSFRSRRNSAPRDHGGRAANSNSGSGANFGGGPGGTQRQRSHPNQRPQSRGVSHQSGGPSETGVVQAVKVLCSEMSREGLDEIRRFIDSMSGY